MAPNVPMDVMYNRLLESAGTDEFKRKAAGTVYSIVNQYGSDKSRWPREVADAYNMAASRLAIR